jgi:Ni,Fe-hydrogenase III large subunit
MGALDQIVGEGRTVEAHRPWPRVTVTADTWRRAIDGLVAEELSLLTLFADAASVHMAISADAGRKIAVLSLTCPDGRYPSVGARHAPAIRLERALRDLHGIEPEGLGDTRPWLDHGRWEIAHPLAPSPGAPDAARPYAFLPTEGEALHQIPVGPVHAGIIEPGHFRFTANGEAVVRLEERLGYVHKGVDRLFSRANVADGARLAGRVSGDSTVAYAYAFALAVEAALGIAVPPRAAWIRALMAELERLANHFGDIGAICNDASFSMIHAHCSVLREKVLRYADGAFGHRLMMDRIVPGGVAVDLASAASAAMADLIIEIRAVFPHLVELYDKTASLQDRTVGTGILTPALARTFAAGGYVGRASSRTFDARRALAYAPYDGLAFDTPVLGEGDVNARLWIRVREVEESLKLIATLAGPPQGALLADLPRRAGEGMAMVEGFRGDVLAWIRLDAEGKIERCHLRDPSWFQWPLLEAAIEGNIVADFPLCNKSFNCSYSGQDL